MMYLIVFFVLFLTVLKIVLIISCYYLYKNKNKNKKNQHSISNQLLTLSYYIYWSVFLLIYIHFSHHTETFISASEDRSSL